MCSWESVDEKSQLYKLFDTILCKGLEHRGSWYLQGVPEPISCGHQGTTAVFRDFLQHGGWCP